MSQTNVYQENGYLNRNQYLEELAEDYDLPVRKVKKLANMLGPEEDFDMLDSSGCNALCCNYAFLFS
jgi:hypothetical protein